MATRANPSIDAHTPLRPSIPTEQTTLKPYRMSLLAALDRIRPRGLPCVSGPLAPELWAGGRIICAILKGELGAGPLTFPLKPSIARQIVDICEPAPFGRGRKTLVDEKVRYAASHDQPPD